MKASVEFRIATYECHIVEALLHIDFEIHLVNYNCHRSEFAYPDTPVAETMRNNIAAVSCVELVCDWQHIEVSLS